MVQELFNYGSLIYFQLSGQYLVYNVLSIHIVERITICYTLLQSDKWKHSELEHPVISWYQKYKHENSHCY